METGSASATVKVKCPSCAKLFAVRRTDVPQGRPQFKCNQCGSKFWFQAPVPEDVSEVKAQLIDEQAAPLAPDSPQPEIQTSTHAHDQPQTKVESPAEQNKDSDKSDSEDLDNPTSESLSANLNTNTEGLGFGGIGLEKGDLEEEEPEEEKKSASPPPPPPPAKPDVPTSNSDSEKDLKTSQATEGEQPESKPAPKPEQKSEQKSEDPLFPKYLVQHPGAEFPCPNCKKPNKKGFPECMFCGIVFEKFLKKQAKDKEIKERQEALPTTEQEAPTNDEVMTPEEAKKKLMQR